METELFRNSDFKSHRWQGNIGVGAAMSYFTEIGWLPLLPISDCTYYDLVVDDGKQLFTVQCKTTSSRSESNSYVVNIATTGGAGRGRTYRKPFDNSRIDYLFVVTSSGIWYNIPGSEVKTVSSITLSESYDQYIVKGAIERVYTEEKVIYKRSYTKKPKEPNQGRKETLNWPSLPELLQLLRGKSFTEVGSILGTSDNSVRKKLKRSGIDTSRLGKYTPGREDYIQELLDQYLVKPEN